nr:KRAB-A domain-containing protein 2-like [Onthophagus taurus]
MDDNIQTDGTDFQDVNNMRINFNAQMKEYCNKSENVVKKPWTKATVEEVIREILDANNPEKKKTSRQYGLTRKYDTMEIGETRVLIKKRRSNEDPVVVMIPVEEYFDRLIQCHRATGHGGRDKMLFELKNKFYISRPAVEMFVSLCKMCNTKKSQQQRNIVVRPITTKDFNLRSQVDLIDFQSTPCRGYKWLMNYQDHATKFCAAEVAMELLKIFLDFGAPHILQSDNGREFTADVVKELSGIWADCKLVHGRPRHPQSQ